MKKEIKTKLFPSKKVKGMLTDGQGAYYPMEKELKLSDKDEQDELQAISQDEENKIWEEEQIRKEFKGEIKFRAWNREKKVMFDDRRFNFYSCREDDDMIIMQFTGLKDKNGKEIFEGDIVRNINKEVFEVRWEEDDLCFVFINNLMDSYKIEHIDTNFKVIGNKFENPELLK